MADVKVEFSVVDKFSQKMDEFESRLKKLEGGSSKLDNSVEEVGKSAGRAGGMFKGFAGAMFIANQAMQAFQKISGSVGEALDDIADKERAIIMLGQDAGNALSDFARTSAQRLGRAQADIMKSALQWRESGIGGYDITALTALADRFANLNPGKSYTDVASALNDAVKNKNVGALAELLGGGEGIEKILNRKGVERSLRSGNVSGAMSKFTEIADAFGYTQEKADKMGMTITRKIDSIVDRVKNKVTEFFSGLVSRAEPYIDRLLDFLESDELDVILDNVQDSIFGIIDGIGIVADSVRDLLESFHSFYDDIIGGSTSTMEMLVGIFVGGFSQIGGSIWNTFIDVWNFIMDGTQNVVNSIIEVVYGVRNKIVFIVYSIKKTITDTISGVLRNVAGVSDLLAGTAIGDVFGFGETTQQVRQLADSIDGLVSTPELLRASEAKIDLSNVKLQGFDSVQRAADNIAAVMNWLKGYTVDHRDRNEKKTIEILSAMKPELAKIRGAMMHEQDLRWLKERAEQRYVNNINFRQLTPTINVKISGSDATPRNIEKTIERVLKEQASAGTYNVYGENV